MAELQQQGAVVVAAVVQRGMKAVAALATLQ
jgi:hypothetical protein